MANTTVRNRCHLSISLLTALLTLAGPAMARAMDVVLKVQESAGVPRVADPVRNGVPLAPGAVQDVNKLRLLDDKGAEVPAQFRVIAQRVDAKGPTSDIEWVSVNFLADVAANATAVYHLTDGGAAPAKAVDKPVTVADGADLLTVVNGPLKLVIPKKTFAGLGEVWLDRAGDGKFDLVSKGGSLTIEGADGRIYHSTADLTAPLKVTLEEQGPLLVVVRIDGEIKAQSADGKDSFYPSWDGKTVTRDGVKMANKDFSLGFTARLHIWKGQTWVRTFLTMRNLNGESASGTDAMIQFGVYFASQVQQPGNGQVDAVNLDLDLATPASANLKYRFGGGLEGSEVISGDLAESKGQATLYQDSSASWYWQAGVNKIWDPRLAKNKEMIADAMAKANRPAGTPFFEWSEGSFPHTTTGVGFSFMGYRFYKGAVDVKPSSFTSFEDLGKESAEGLRAPGWVEVDDGKTAVTVGCRWFWQMCPKSIEVKAPGTVSMGLWSRYFRRGHLFEGKIHKTHELVYDFRPSGGASKGLGGEKRFAAFAERLIAWPTAEHNLASRVYGDFMLPNPQEWPRYEQSAISPVQGDPKSPLNPGQISSIEIEREKYECYDVWKFGDSVKADWHHFGQYMELDVPYCLMVQYARLGDRRLFNEAEIATRNLLDVPAHGGGYGHQRGEPSHYYAFGPSLYANFAGEPYLRDAVLCSQKIVDPGCGHLRSCAVMLWSNWTMYRNFPEEQKLWREKMEHALKWAADNGGMMGGWDPSAQPFFFGLGGDSIGRYCETFPEDKARRDMLVAAYRTWMNKFKDGTDEEKKMHYNLSLANGFAFAARFSGDETLLDFAAKYCARDSDFRPNYRTGVSSAKNWTEYGHRLTQVFLHDIDKKRHPEKYKDLP